MTKERAIRQVKACLDIISDYMKKEEWYDSEVARIRLHVQHLNDYISWLYLNGKN